jgi:hypothetical protein
MLPRPFRIDEHWRDDFAFDILTAEQIDGTHMATNPVTATREKADTNIVTKAWGPGDRGEMAFVVLDARLRADRHEMRSGR